MKRLMITKNSVVKIQHLVMNHKPQSLTSIPEKVSNSEAAPNGAKLAMGQRKSRHKKTNFLRVDDFLNI